MDACERPNLDKEVGAKGCLIFSNLYSKPIVNMITDPAIEFE